MADSVSVLVSVYGLLAAAFFAFCAYAQLNDPDPELWIFLYLVGGPGITALTALDAALQTRSSAARAIRTFLAAWLLATGAYALYIVAGLVSRIDYGLPLRELGWSFLQFEEGREISGLALLAGHTGFLLQCIGARDAQAVPTRKAHGRGAPTGTSSLLISGLLIGSFIAAATYAWVMYQPHMNQRDNVEHCNGVFQ
jgi:hypothetical protein